MATKRPVGLNPLVCDTPVDTVDYCRSVLKWMTSTRDIEGGQDVDFGRSLVLETIGSALEHVSAQLQAKQPPHLEVANG